MIEGDLVRASDRTYIFEHGSLRVYDYRKNGVEKSDVYQPHPVAVAFRQQEIIDSLKAKFSEVENVKAEEVSVVPEQEALPHNENMEGALENNPVDA